MNYYGIEVEVDTYSQILTIDGVAFSYDFFKEFAKSADEGRIIKLTRGNHNEIIVARIPSL